MLGLFFIVTAATLANYYINSFPLNKPNKKTFAIIRIINAVYYVRSLFESVLRRLSSRWVDKIEITAVYTYPIKSCRGVSLESCYIDDYGLKYDRMYMFGQWDGKRFKSVTQRECPGLSLCTVELVGDSFKVQWPNSDECFYLPTEMTDEFLKAHSRSHESPVHLWEVGFKTSVLEGVLPESFINDVGLPANTKMLFSRGGKFVKTNVPSPLRSTRSTHFQEYFPLLLMSEEDLEDFKSRFRRKNDDISISFHNFRPNLVVRGVKPYEIDRWNKITIGGKRWLIISKCPRCTIPNIDQDTGKVDAKSRISKELMSYRRCDPGNPYLAFLGVHGIQLDTGYNLQVGDAIQVFRKRINFYKALE